MLLMLQLPVAGQRTADASLPAFEVCSAVTYYTSIKVTLQKTFDQKSGFVLLPWRRRAGLEGGSSGFADWTVGFHLLDSRLLDLKLLGEQWC